MPKNIVVFADGTGQDGGVESQTNVYKMFNMVEDRTDRQVCFYDPGVGSTGFLSRVPGLAGGRGFGRNVRDCYRFIFDEYQSGDRIFLIGFSRGAATVRSLSYFLHLFGILPRSRRELIGRAWDIYTIRDPGRRRARAAAFNAAHRTIWTRVHFLGCYDTVAALGMPYRWASRLLDRVPGFKHRFHDFRLSPGVEYAYHALALDDRRRTFHPVLWDPVEDEAGDPTGTRREVDPLVVREMRQVWFAGMHSDVGGGYHEQELSDIPLVWLTGRAVERGLRIWPRHRVRIAEDADGHMHDSRGTFWSRLYREAGRTWDPTRPDRPVLHESAMARTRSVGNGDEPRYGAWIAQYDAIMEPWVRFTEQPWGAGVGVDASASSRTGVRNPELSGSAMPRSEADG